MDAIITSWTGSEKFILNESLMITHIVTSSNAFDVAADLKTQSRVQTTCWFIQEKNFGVCDQST
jgi:hypothetical protein